MTGVLGVDTGVAIQATTAGDDVAFARIVDAHHEDKRRVGVVMTGDEALAEDAVRSAWSIAWRKLGSVRDPARLRPWLVTVAVNLARDMLRKRRRLPETELSAVAARVAGGVDPATGIESLDLVAAMGRLGPEHRALIAMAASSRCTSWMRTTVSRIAAPSASAANVPPVRRVRSPDRAQAHSIVRSRSVIPSGCSASQAA